MVSRFVLLCTLLLTSCLVACAQWDRASQQIDLESLPDSTDQLQAVIDDNQGNLILTNKHYRISKPLLIDLEKHGAAKVTSRFGSTLIMDGSGPAIRLKGTHQGTASPKTFNPNTWNQRMPILSGFEILGAAPEADGIELEQTVGAALHQVSVRWCRHGIHLVNRNRNVIISDCHLYENAGVGVYLDNVNLHQINIANSHISYNRKGGVVVRDGNVRNIQITGCDIEGNMPADATPTKTANVLIDVSGSPDDKTKSVAEIAITGCTIQHSANYGGKEAKTVAPGGANIRLAGKEVYPIDSVTISGNVLSDTTSNIDILFANDVAINANNFFAPQPNNLLVRNSRRVVVSGNTFNPRQFIRPGTIRFVDSSDCILANSTIHQFATEEGAVILQDCDGMNLTGLNLSDCGSGILLSGCSNTSLIGCRATRTAKASFDLRIDESNESITLSGNAFSGNELVNESAIHPQSK